jgi:deoxyribose-phosphate aldolase
VDFIENPTRLAGLIDHTLLKPEAGERAVIALCDEARTHGFASVCVNPSWVRLCSTVLHESPVVVCTVIGFPLGANKTEVKLRETELAAHDGAREFDMVMHIGRFRDRDFAYVEHDIVQVVRAAMTAVPDSIVKVILETAMLDEGEIRDACRIATQSGAHFVKTSTGFGPGGATPEAVRLMRDTVGNDCGVKASGGIRDRATTLTMIEAGANRIGTSSGITILTNE